MNTSRTRLLAAALTSGVLLGSAGAALPVAASGAAAAQPTVEIIGNNIVFTAAAGADDDVIILGTEDGTLGFGGVTGSGATSTSCPDAHCDITGIDRLVVYLRDGDDTVYADIPWHIPALPFVIHGGSGDDSIGGNAGYADKLYGEAGNDYIRGHSGADHILGGKGKDTLRGARGGDVIRGGAGQDELRGERGADTLFSVDGSRDSVNGGPDRDTATVDDQDEVVAVERLL
jgi:Ca2+-binding RTX toxin-like protein